MEQYEVIIVGGGPAGLSAALYLARYDRQVALFDAGQGRSTWHQINHNYLGFPGGVPAKQLRERGYEQIAEYEQVTVLKHKIETMHKEGDLFIASGQAGEWAARAVILCTGVIDHYPHFEGWHEYVGRSMFWCITCDGYACKGEKVVVAGNTNDTASMAMQLTRMTGDVTLLTNSEDFEIEERFVKRLKNAGVPIIRDKIDSVLGEDGMMHTLILKSGEKLALEQLFSHQGATPQTDLAEQLGVTLAGNGYILVDTEQKTTVPGVYAAGDVTRLHSHQITTAVHEGGTAASAANYFLYPPELRDD
jgi:thioredoxin reductase (NADPH)